MIDLKNTPKTQELLPYITELRHRMYPDIVFDNKSRLYVFLMKVNEDRSEILLSQTLRSNGMNTVMQKIRRQLDITIEYDDLDNPTFFKNRPIQWIALSVTNNQQIKRKYAAVVLLVYGCLNNLFTNNQRRD